MAQDKIKIPPQNLEAEKIVLGSLLIDKNAIYKIADILDYKDFYNPIHEKIYHAIFELFGKNQPIDILTLSNFFKEKGDLSAIGGSAFLTELVNSVATSSHVEHYATIVKEKKILRDLIDLSSFIGESVFNSSDTVDELVDRIEQKIVSVSQKSIVQKLVNIRDELKEAFERIEKLHAGGSNALRGVPTGFAKLDSLLSGLQKSDLIILGARPSMGKTSLALDIARNAAFSSNIPIGVFSLEMSREQVVDRFISAESSVPLWRLRTGRISDDMEFEMIQGALDRLSHSPIFIDDTPSPSILQIRAMARRLQMEHGLGLIIVDYLQLITARTRSDNLVQQITEVSHGLKALARELSVPVLALAQLSRSVEQRDTRIPRLSDLRDSGSIEQDADIVLFIYRKDRDKSDVPEEEKNTAEIIIAKHRNGPLGSVKLKFDQEKASFSNIDEIHIPENDII
ncbi:MAG: replicative DNA helicase [Candidatus Liptonbacteria bacterium RIFOXYC1_FULL_36_8]|uniref:Replicative DNA helicase n=2 Tax=Candidatus Liptoniibacteriota TaxID=1817909 RepID=A0A1G2CLD5_9BACT|nr:MAG: replicative DNA helicase [Candidatus Liptonbacteria bacterium RIFOXYB1_FULL_36_10]OGZ03556.1 MAG: replicative DNA helicase [Candidatus Liptonbacteria bacterium RIFOXYC1_FULL_36_8]